MKKSAFMKELEDLIKKAPVDEHTRISATVPAITVMNFRRAMMKNGEINRSAVITKLIKDYIERRG